jgi:hypothetical protein
MDFQHHFCKRDNLLHIYYSDMLREETKKVGDEFSQSRKVRARTPELILRSMAVVA